MSVDDFYLKFCKEFPHFLESADADFRRRFGELGHDMKFLWFESLANSINYAMAKEIPPKRYKGLFEFMRKAYIFENQEIKKCIEVSFVENIFWNVSKDNAMDYWLAFPEVLKGLYIAFYGKQPV